MSVKYILDFIKSDLERISKLVSFDFNWSVGPVGNTASSRSLRSDFCLREGIALSPVEGSLDQV